LLTENQERGVSPHGNAIGGGESRVVQGRKMSRGEERRSPGESATVFWDTARRPIKPKLTKGAEGVVQRNK